MASTGAITVDTANAIASTSLTASVTTNAGAETHTYSAFLVEVADCLLSVTFPSISDKRVQKSSSLTINAGATSASSICVPTAHVLSPTLAGVTIDSSG